VDRKVAETRIASIRARILRENARKKVPLERHIALGIGFREALGLPLDPLMKKALSGQLSADESAKFEKWQVWSAEAPKGVADEVEKLQFLYGPTALRRIVHALEKGLGPRQRRSRRTTDRVDWSTTIGRKIKANIRALHLLGEKQLDACVLWQESARGDPSLRSFVDLDAQSLRKQVFDR
jgi:hypothetical protein